MDIEVYKDFFEKVAEIKRKNEEKVERGEEFNIFWLLGIESNELYHSYIIAELLNPDSFHGQGNIFLKEFEKIVIEPIKKKKSDFKFSFDSGVTTQSEYQIGEINKDYTEGGRIDILLTDKDGNKIIIENKIYANDQKNQLLRYRNYAQKDGKDYLILYLSLYGANPSDFSAGGLELDKDYFTISYKKEICNWLENCHKQVMDKNKVFYLVDSYLEMLQYLTKNKISGVFHEIIELLKSNQDVAKILIENQLKINTTNFWQEYSTDTVDFNEKYKFIKTSIEYLIKEIRITFATEIMDMVNSSFGSPISIFVEQCSYFNNGNECYGLGYKVLKNQIPLNYGGNSFGGFGDAVFINGVNAHLGENIDSTNSMLFQAYINGNWKEIIHTSANLIIQNLKNINY